ncbi:hypothetical protein BDV34DRAFT_2548 [Aspergillus parasiticus]|uniref:Uncharacterized protein n=1 Tax=Aspergillus parasiticus TaxID=5067 RepID=A0A5N6E6C5_ASPPA|nr:hypothetical protein BDV34DRAFT_2548 [Aspergillus parasiticus]
MMLSALFRGAPAQATLMQPHYLATPVYPFFDCDGAKRSGTLLLAAMAFWIVPNSLCSHVNHVLFFVSLRMIPAHLRYWASTLLYFRQASRQRLWYRLLMN